MFIPGTLICDFCKGTIDTDLPYPTVDLPLPLALRKKIQTVLQQQAAAAMGADTPAAVQAQIVVPLMVVPTSFKIEVCQGCIDGFFMGVGKVLEEQVIYSVTQKSKQIEKRQRAGVAQQQETDDDE